MWFKGFSQILKAYTPRFLSLLCSFLFSASLIAQINIQVGYGLSFMDLAENTQILQKYNASNAWLSSGFGAIKVLNGLQIGLRYTGRIGSCGFNWTYGQANTKAEGLNPSDNLEYNRTIYYKLESYNFLLETGSQWIQFGTSINLNYLSIKDKFTPNTNKTQITRQTAWGSQFYINVGLSNGCLLYTSYLSVTRMQHCRNKWFVRRPKQATVRSAWGCKICLEYRRHCQLYKHC